MIKSILKIKNFPSFVDFKPTNDLPEFSKYNLIYGWNGSGKTCFSRILRSFELGQNFFDISERESEFEFKLYDETTISNIDLSTFKNIRVFNKDFIDDSIFCDSGPKPIFFLGKQSKEDKEKIAKAEIDLTFLNKDVSAKEIRFNKAKENKDKTLSDKAREIRTALTTPTRNDKYRNYERPILEESIKNNLDVLKKPNLFKLSEDHITGIKKTILQTSLNKIEEISIPNFDITEPEKEIRSILSKAVVSQIITKLQEDELVSKWVEKGLEIHKAKNLKVCAFCNQKIPSNRIVDLEKHFNDEYQKMLSAVQELKNKCNSIRENILFPESSTFYDDLANEYLIEKKKAENALLNFDKLLNALIIVLEKKEQNLFSQPILNKIVSVDTTPFSKINEIIKRHNEKTDNFENQIDKNKKDFELHFINEFFPRYIEILQENDLAHKEYSVSLELVKKKGKEIRSLKQSLINHHIPTKQINKHLEQFLGRNDIQLNATESKEGYQIIRNGVIAKNLSEGERTAIAIVYFLAKIKEDGFDLSNGAVVIDDPVCSLDSNSIFQAFSFIKESIKDAGQIFILTHHFDFFRQVKNWFKFFRNDKCFYMMVCSESSGIRESSLVKIDDLLIKYESEYHFLFSILYRISVNKEKDLEKVYSIPNVARKFLENFLAFRVPIIKNTGEPSIYMRLKEIKFDKIKKTRIQRFVETHSHPRYENGIQDFDMTILSETSSIVTDLLKLVKTEDERHYNFMVKSITS